MRPSAGGNYKGNLEPPYEGSKVMLKIKKRWITSKYKGKIYRARRIDQIKAYCTEKYGISEEIFKSVY